MAQKLYDVIYADPSWQYGSKHYQDGNRDFKKLDNIYNKVSSFKELKELPVKYMTDSPSLIFMWVTGSHLKEGIELMEKWGFKQKTIAFVWVKIYETGNYCYNFAPWTLPSVEICLLGTKGTKFDKQVNNTKQLVVEDEMGNLIQGSELKDHRDRIDHIDRIVEYMLTVEFFNLAVETRTQHSVKPDEIRKRIETLVGDIPKIELFAREKNEGWDVWGDQVDNSIDILQYKQPTGNLTCEVCGLDGEKLHWEFSSLTQTPIEVCENCKAQNVVSELLL